MDSSDDLVVNIMILCVNVILDECMEWLSRSSPARAADAGSTSGRSRCRAWGRGLGLGEEASRVAAVGGGTRHRVANGTETDEPARIQSAARDRARKEHQRVRNALGAERFQA
jgi:hypothetical protein